LKIGVVLPTFRSDATAALAVADAVESAGLDGVFCWDHLWPMGQPERPALAPFPVLATIACRTERVHLGTLVARIGLAPNEVLISEFLTLDRLAPGRVVAGIGTGDRLSAAENEAYGVPAGSAQERRAALGACAAALRDRGLTVWVGGASPRTRLVAEELGVVVNLWDVAPDAVVEQSRRSEVTWAGPPPRSVGVVRGGAEVEPPLDNPRAPPPQPQDEPAEADRAITERLHQLADAGATWAVFAWPVPLGTFASCAKELTGGR
jgi:alkanesulfonate monooxygenase SsuD/methylene tetrahydromethanopterin reductase-like flavin-dependent oxidoreductase (luciferase family)